jgi:hypothetical protein
MGTGTTAFAALATGRNSAGYEIDPGFRPVIESRMAGLKVFCNEMVNERLARHESFMNARLQGGSPGHRSEAYGFPVVTGQEAGIALPIVEEIRLLDGECVVTYRPWPENKG